MAKPFNNINSVVINESEAKKYFGNINNALGKILSIVGSGDFAVSGVMQDFPQNSTLQYNMLLPMSLYATIFANQGGNGNWKIIDEDLGNYHYNIYLSLHQQASPETVSKKLSQLYQNQKKDDEEASKSFFTLQPLQTLHLIEADGNKSALQTVKIFSIIGIIILIIACINYVNISTARSMLRSKEISVRKIIGAAKHQLFIQFILESAVLFILASLLAFALIFLLLPLYNDISGKRLLFNLNNISVWITIVSTIICTLLLGSIYPALLFTSLKPLQVLKGKLPVGIGTTSFRKILVVTQFVFSVILITATIIIIKQLQYIKEKDLGYDKSQVFSFALTKNVHDHYDALRNDLLKQPGILAVASSNNGFIGPEHTTGDTYWEGKAEGSMFLIHPNSVDEDFIPLLKMQIVKGENFSGTPADSNHFIINETAMRQAGIKNPVGKKFKLWQLEGTIIGVLEDYNYASLKKAIEPAIFYYGAENWTMYIKTSGRDAPKAIASVQRNWKTYEEDMPFQYSFLDEDFNKLYQSDEKAGVLIKVFATVAILISCLGLFGLITFMAQVKTKEISIRKVLGANILNITLMLTREFVLLILMAFIIATPISWYSMNKWLQNFAYKINLQWYMFVAAGVIALMIALITVGFQAIKAAIANPVKSLRVE